MLRFLYLVVFPQSRRPAGPGSQAVSDGAGTLKKPKCMTRQPIELVRIVLTDRSLQCLDRSVAEGGGVVPFTFRLRVRHGATGVGTRSSDTGLERCLIGADCGLMSDLCGDSGAGDGLRVSTRTHKRAKVYVAGDLSSSRQRTSMFAIS